MTSRRSGKSAATESMYIGCEYLLFWRPAEWPVWKSTGTSRSVHSAYSGYTTSSSG